MLIHDVSRSRADILHLHLLLLLLLLQATVTYADPHAAEAATKWFNNKEVMGRTVHVSFANRPDGDNLPASHYENPPHAMQPPPQQGGGGGQGGRAERRPLTVYS